MGNKKKNKIEYGDVDFPEGTFAPENVKIRISCMIDGDVKQELKKRAKQGAGDGKYQTLLNAILRHHLFGEPSPLSTASTLKLTDIADIVRQLAEKAGIDATKIKRSERDVMESLRD